MKTDRTGKLLVAGLVAGLFYVGTALFSLSGASMTQSADAQFLAPSLTTTHDDVLITNSLDGKKLYIWTFGHRQTLDVNRMPIFQCEITAE